MPRKLNTETVGEEIESGVQPKGKEVQGKVVRDQDEAAPTCAIPQGDAAKETLAGEDSIEVTRVDLVSLSEPVAESPPVNPE